MVSIFIISVCLSLFSQNIFSLSVSLFWYDLERKLLLRGDNLVNQFLMCFFGDKIGVNIPSFGNLSNQKSFRAGVTENVCLCVCMGECVCICIRICKCVFMSLELCVCVSLCECCVCTFVFVFVCVTYIKCEGVCVYFYIRICVCLHLCSIQWNDFLILILIPAATTGQSPHFSFHSIALFSLSPRKKKKTISIKVCSLHRYYVGQTGNISYLLVPFWKLSFVH